MKNKLLSGRFLLTVTASIVFAYCAASETLGPDIVATLCTMVFISYFQRSDRNNGGQQ